MLRQILRIALKSAEESKQETSLGLKKKEGTEDKHIGRF